MFPLDAVNVIPALLVPLILAVAAVKSELEVSLIDPAVAVIVRAPLADELVEMALAPNNT